MPRENGQFLPYEAISTSTLASFILLLSSFIPFSFIRQRKLLDAFLCIIFYILNPFFHIPCIIYRHFASYCIFYILWGWSWFIGESLSCFTGLEQVGSLTEECGTILDSIDRRWRLRKLLWEGKNHYEKERTILCH